MVGKEMATFSASCACCQKSLEPQTPGALRTYLDLNKWCHNQEICNVIFRFENRVFYLGLVSLIFRLLQSVYLVLYLVIKPHVFLTERRDLLHMLCNDLFADFYGSSCSVPYFTS